MFFFFSCRVEEILKRWKIYDILAQSDDFTNSLLIVYYDHELKIYKDKPTI